MTEIGSDGSDDFDFIWKELDSTKRVQCVQESVVDSQEPRANERECECGSTNVRSINNDIICCDCGLVLTSDRLSMNGSFESIVAPVYHNRCKNNRLTKMQEWYMWSNAEKNTYKLKEYTRALCNRLHIFEGLVNNVVDTVVRVIDTIKRNEGTKRARVKDGIIVTCIYYVSKDTTTPYSYIEMSKQLSLDMKYITRAERTILELVNAKRLHFDNVSVLTTEKPYDYIVTAINRHDIRISQDTLHKIRVLIDICEDNDLLLDHTPLSIGVCCFYYVLKHTDIQIDVKLFSEMYSLSMVTVIKTYNKLKVHSEKINRILQL